MTESGLAAVTRKPWRSKESGFRISKRGFGFPVRSRMTMNLGSSWDSRCVPCSQQAPSCPHSPVLGSQATHYCTWSFMWMLKLQTQVLTSPSPQPRKNFAFQKTNLCMSVLPTCKFPYHLCIWYAWRLEEGVRFHELKIWMAKSCHLGAKT